MTAAANSPDLEPPPAGRGRQVVLALVGTALFLVFVALGTWQVERRAWKLALIARVDQRVHAPPGPLPARSTWPQVNATEHEYLPVALQGRWLAGRTVLTQAVTELGAGFWVITPLEQEDGTQVLVNRGFVPQEQRAQWLGSSLPSPAAAASTPVSVQGLLRMTEPGGGFLRANDPARQRWHSRDVAAISRALQLPAAAPFFIDAGLPTAASGSGWPRAGLTVVRFHNSHLVYALTWYGLAAMVAAAGWYVARYEHRRSRLRASSPLPPDDRPSP